MFYPKLLLNPQLMLYPKSTLIPQLMFYPQLILTPQIMLYPQLILTPQLIFSLTPQIINKFFYPSLCSSYLPPFVVYQALTLHTIIIYITLLTNGLRPLSLSFSYLYRHDLSTFCPIDWLLVTENETVRKVFHPSVWFLGFLFFY